MFRCISTGKGRQKQAGGLQNLCQGVRISRVVSDPKSLLGRMSLTMDFGLIQSLVLQMRSIIAFWVLNYMILGSRSRREVCCDRQCVASPGGYHVHPLSGFALEACMSSWMPTLYLPANTGRIKRRGGQWPSSSTGINMRGDNTCTCINELCLII